MPVNPVDQVFLQREITPGQDDGWTTADLDVLPIDGRLLTRGMFTTIDLGDPEGTADMEFQWSFEGGPWTTHTNLKFTAKDVWYEATFIGSGRDPGEYALRVKLTHESGTWYSNIITILFVAGGAFMATTTTFREIVNEVLAAVGVPELSAAGWGSATGKPRQVKRIVSRIHQSLQNRLPDEHWQVQIPLKLYRAGVYTGGTSGVSGITTSDPARVTFDGIGSDINAAPDGFLPLGAAGAVTAQDCMIQIATTTPDVTPARDWVHEQWYRVQEVIDGTNIDLATEHLADDESQTPSAASPNLLAFNIVQYRTALPSDFRDIQDTHYPFGIANELTKVGINELIRMIRTSGSTITATHPTHYAIGYDVNIKTPTAPLGPFIYWYPFPTDTRLYNLHYQRFVTELDIDGAESLTIDMPEDMVTELIYLATMRAQVDVANNSEGAGIYSQLAQQQHQDTTRKTMTAVETSPITPQMQGYRGQVGRRSGRGPRIWVEE